MAPLDGSADLHTPDLRDPRQRQDGAGHDYVPPRTGGATGAYAWLIDGAWDDHAARVAVSRSTIPTTRGEYPSLEALMRASVYTVTSDEPVIGWMPRDRFAWTVFGAMLPTERRALIRMAEEAAADGAGFDTAAYRIAFAAILGAAAQMLFRFHPNRQAAKDAHASILTARFQADQRSAARRAADRREQQDGAAEREGPNQINAGLGAIYRSTLDNAFGAEAVAEAIDVVLAVARDRDSDGHDSHDHEGIASALAQITVNDIGHAPTPKEIRRVVRAQARLVTTSIGDTLRLVGRVNQHVASTSRRRIFADHARSLQQAADMAILSDAGEIIALSDMTARAKRRKIADLRAFVRALDGWRRAQGYGVRFITNTCPGWAHANPDKGEWNADPVAGGPAARLNLLKGAYRNWTKRTNDHARETGRPIVGFRVIEGTKGGAPHFHILVFAHPDDDDFLAQQSAGLEQWPQAPGGRVKRSRDKRTKAVIPGSWDITAAAAPAEGGDFGFARLQLRAIREKEDGTADNPLRSITNYLFKYLSKSLAIEGAGGRLAEKARADMDFGFTEGEDPDEEESTGTAPLSTATVFGKANLTPSYNTIGIPRGARTTFGFLRRIDLENGDQGGDLATLAGMIQRGEPAAISLLFDSARAWERLCRLHATARTLARQSDGDLAACLEAAGFTTYVEAAAARVPLLFRPAFEYRAGAAGIGRAEPYGVECWQIERAADAISAHRRIRRYEEGEAPEPDEREGSPSRFYMALPDVARALGHGDGAFREACATVRAAAGPVDGPTMTKAEVEQKAGDVLAQRRRSYAQAEGVKRDAAVARGRAVGVGARTDEERRIIAWESWTDYLTAFRARMAERDARLAAIRLRHSQPRTYRPQPAGPVQSISPEAATAIFTAIAAAFPNTVRSIRDADTRGGAPPEPPPTPPDDGCPR